MFHGLQEVAHGAKHALGRARDVVGDDVRVTVKRVETPFISIHSKTVKELLAGGIAGKRGESLRKFLRFSSIVQGSLHRYTRVRCARFFCMNVLRTSYFQPRCPASNSHRTGST